MIVGFNWRCALRLQDWTYGVLMNARRGRLGSSRRSDNRDPLDLNVKEERQGHKHGAPSPIRTHDGFEDFTPGPVEPGVKERKRQNGKQRDHGEVVPWLRAGKPTG